MKPGRTIRAAGASLALAWAALAPCAAAAQEAAPELAVVATAADAELQPIARGFDLWLRDQLAIAGVAVIPLAGTREVAFAEAAQQRMPRVLAPRLQAGAGRAGVALPFFAPESGALLGGARGQAALGEVGNACAEALDRLLAQLGLPPGEGTPPPGIDDLASASRAIAAWEAGNWVGAWREVQGRLTPTAMGLREDLMAAARSGGSDGDVVERARVLAAAGDTAEAARLVGRMAAEALRESSPDPRVLIAGGEVALARGDVREARLSFDRALAGFPDSPDAHMGLARALALQQNPEEARAALLRAAELVPDDPAPWLLLAEVQVDDRPAAARNWLEAGRRSARQLEVQRARSQVERALLLDPTLAGDAHAASGELEERLGRPVEALAAYRRAAGAGVKTPTLLVATGRAQRALGQREPARASLEAALQLAPQDPAALAELGSLHLESNDPQKAVSLLQAAHNVNVNDTGVRQRYAQALEAIGDPAKALELLKRPDAGPQELRLAARIQSRSGDLAGAREALALAVAAEPLDPELRRETAALLEQLGDAAGAKAARELATQLGGAEAQAQAQSGSGEPLTESVGALSLDELVTSFAAQLPRGEKRVISLGVREPGDLGTWLWRLARPRGPRRAHVERALQSAIDARFGKDGAGILVDEELDVHVDRLYEFEAERSLDAQTIAAVNQVLATDALFVARVVTDTPWRTPLCDPGDFAIELRLLVGRDPELVSALANMDCVRGGLASYGAWNWPAFALYLLAALFVGWPLIRGWGAIDVHIKLPERTKGFFSIHITRKTDAVKKERVSKKSDRKQMKAGMLDFLKRFERHMAGRETHFRLIPARKQPYTVTVAGPLLDARGEEIIGHFLEEQKVQVSRGLASKLTFDFCPRECAVEVRVLKNGEVAQGGRVAVEGDPSSLRYARDGVAYLYLPVGRYTLLAGSKDAALARPLEIASVEKAIPLQLDFDHDAGVVFRNCPQAVESYLQSDLASAAGALEAAGQAEPAHALRAALYKRQGRHDEAAREFEASGRLEDAAQARAHDEDFGASAQLFEQAGEFGRAGEAHRNAGDFTRAAECFERAYDYADALECWREVGDRERELILLEKLGEYLDAAQLARELGDADRALSLLGNMDARHTAFAEACRLVAEIATERGDYDLAVSKLEESLGASGMDAASIEMLECYAAACDRAQRPEQALSTYELLRRRDPARSDVATHVARLRQTLAASKAAQQAGSGTAATVPVESRYELLEEIGRGGMGVVYKARDKRLGRVIALKRLPESMKHHPQAMELFEREARAAAALNHRNIVTVYDAGLENGIYFISMELLEGRGLNQILAKAGRLKPTDVMRLGMQICAGLHFAHERRIVHRDIKCSNLFFTNERVVKIMDFGIAKSLEEVRRQATVIGGTPYYMAPEQADGEAVDHRADIYALGVTFFQLATGELPFTDGDINYRHKHEPAPDPRELVMDMPERLAQLILAMMGKQPDERPASAAEVGEVLRVLLAQMGAR